MTFDPQLEAHVRQAQVVHHAERAHDKEDEAWHKSNDATISSATVALRTAVLVNGGAAIALLAFIGGTLNDSKVPLSTMIDQLTAPLVWFALGVVTATLAMGCMYLINFSNTMILASRTQNWESPFIRETTVSRRWRMVSRILTVVAIICSFISLGLFVYGVFDIRLAISGVQAPI